jgi:acyl-coenzyme A thioesterase PaaI-like protein
MSLVTVDAVNAFVERDFAGSGSRCEEVGQRWATARFDFTGVGLRPGGIISGPTVFGVCDASLYYACFTAIGIEPMALTSELSIRFMRPATGIVLRARADLHHVGRRSIIGSVVAWTDDIDKPVAVAQGTYVRPLVSAVSDVANNPS